MTEPQGNQSPTGQGNPEPKTGDGNGDAKLFTDEQGQALNELINRAFTARSKASEAKIEKALADLTTGFTGKLEEFSKQFDALKPKEPDKPKDKKDAIPPVTEAPEFQELQKQLAKLTKQNEDSARKAAESEARRRDTLLRQKAHDALVSAGVDPKRARQALGLLVDADKRIRFADADSEDIVFVNGDDTVDLAAGLKAWAKSDDAQIFLPPRGTSGSGDRGGGRAPQPPQGSKEELKRQLGEQLLNVL